MEMINKLYYSFKNFVYYKLYKRKLRPAQGWYIETDERIKYIHILEAVNYVRVAELPNVFFEFGCHSGRTFSAALLSSKFLQFDIESFAFDSFEGLPQTHNEEDGIFKSGTFRTKIDRFITIIKKKTGIRLKDKQLIKGFYEDSLTNDLKTNLPDKVGFVHIDVDLYSSTVPVLEFVKDFLTIGTVILFDDWYCFAQGKEMGERKALNEFLTKYPTIELEDWKNYSTFGKSFFVRKI